ncbi:flagellar basal body-associated FliL family protein [Proteiniborus sp.]|uniref:flagellar basal body-associated FliL family protein n=1 Tax=Proteiniborus sp. TaxID=2079015 RepID=UPI0033205F65
MSTKKILLIALISFIMLLLLIGAVFLLVSYKNNIAQNKAVENFYYEIDEMYCNLKNSNKIIKMKMTIELTDEKIIDELNNRNFSIKHEINTIMANKTEDDLEGKEGLLALQSEITNKLAEVFSTKGITKVYFEEIIVQ